MEVHSDTINAALSAFQKVIGSSHAAVELLELRVTKILWC